MHTIDQVAGLIDEYTVTYSFLLQTCTGLGLPLTNSPLFNFRDALGHYSLLYDAKDDETKIAHETSIVEHLHRGLRDGCYFILQKLKIGLQAELKAKLSIPDRCRELRSLLHRCKSLELRMRKLVIITSAEIDVCIIELDVAVADIRTSFNKYDIEWDFSKYQKAHVI